MKKILIGKIFLTMVSAVTFLSSCVNLKKVNDFSSNSQNGIKKYEDIGYSFSKACNNRCAIEQLNKELIFQTNCNCSLNKVADSVTQILYNSIKGYLAGLTKLSDNDLTNYKFDGLNKALIEGKFGDITINKIQVQSYSKISEVLLKAFTDSYRKKKLSKYIAEANEPMHILINALAFNLEGNLAGKLNVEKERYKSYYFDLAKDANASLYEKKKVIEEYNATVLNIETKEKQIKSFGKILKGISDGHQKLYDGRSKFNSKELKELLIQYSSDLQDIISEFNKLKNEN